MKYGVIVCKETANIGDDIQSYAAACLLPEVNYYIEREHMDVFRPEEGEPVNAIINGWLMNNKLGWPLSSWINPLYVSMHFQQDNSMLIQNEFLEGLGSEDLIKHAPIGARDTETMEFLSQNGIPCYFSGCITLTLPQKFKREVREPYICLTDIKAEAVEFVRKQYPDMKICVVEHEPINQPALVNQEADWPARFKKVEDLLALYQNASAVITTRLHCAMPCLALNTPVLLLMDQEVFEPARLSGLSDFLEVSTTQDFISGKTKYDLASPPANFPNYIPYRNKLIETVQQFVSKNMTITPELQERIASYDKNWEERALWKNRILLKLPQKHDEQWRKHQSNYAAMNQEIDWLAKQNEILIRELEAIKQWCEELQAGNHWLEQQNADIVKEMGTVKQWSEELRAGNQWLEKEKTNLVAELEAMKQWCEELKVGNQWLKQENTAQAKELENLKQWCAELTNGNQWLTQQNASLSQELHKINDAKNM